MQLGQICPKALVTVQHTSSAGVLLDEQHISNLVTNLGRVAFHTYLYGAGGQRSALGGGFNYIALSTDSAAPNVTDSVLAGEIVEGVGTAGLGRALGTVTLPTGTGTLTAIQKVFTYTGVPGPITVQKAALFDAASSGVLRHEVAFTPRTLFTNETLTVTFSITFVG